MQASKAGWAFTLSMHACLGEPPFKPLDIKDLQIQIDFRSWSCDDYVVLGKRACPELTTRLALSNFLVKLFLPFTTFISLTSADNFSSRTPCDLAHSRPLSLPTGVPGGISLPIWMGLNSAVIKVLFELVVNWANLLKPSCSRLRFKEPVSDLDKPGLFVY